MTILHGDSDKNKPAMDYPDISDILARKAQGKREASKRTFAEKIAMVEALYERLAPLKAAREARKRAAGKI